MTDFIEPIRIALQGFNWRDALDIIIVTFIMYALIKLLARSRALRIAIGLGVILVCARIFELLNFTTVSWLLSWILNASAILIVVLFQPEIRRALEKLGQGRIFKMSQTNVRNGEYLIAEFSRAILNMAKHKVGAIIVFERKTGLAEVLESGTMLDAKVSSELVENIFYPNTPLHDGAVVVKGSRLVAAGCFLPLSENKHIASELGTRHRAALGVSEVSDAYVLVVSEERGTISFAYDGVLQRYIDAKELKKILSKLYLLSEDQQEKGKGKKVDLSAETKEINITDIMDRENAASREDEEDSEL